MNAKEKLTARAYHMKNPENARTTAAERKIASAPVSSADHRRTDIAGLPFADQAKRYLRAYYNGIIRSAKAGRAVDPSAVYESLFSANYVEDNLSAITLAIIEYRKHTPDTAVKGYTAVKAKEDETEARFVYKALRRHIYHAQTNRTTSVKVDPDNIGNRGMRTNYRITENGEAEIEKISEEREDYRELATLFIRAMQEDGTSAKVVETTCKMLHLMDGDTEHAQRKYARKILRRIAEETGFIPQRVTDKGQTLIIAEGTDTEPGKSQEATTAPIIAPIALKPTRPTYTGERADGTSTAKPIPYIITDNRISTAPNTETETEEQKKQRFYGFGIKGISAEIIAGDTRTPEERKRDRATIGEIILGWMERGETTEEKEQFFRDCIETARANK